MRIHINMYQLKTYFLDLITNRVLLLRHHCLDDRSNHKGFYHQHLPERIFPASAVGRQRGNAQFSFGCGDGHGHFLRIALRI